MHVVLLHGLARRSSAFGSLARALASEGHTPHLVDYRSRARGLRDLAGDVLGELDRRGISNLGDDLAFVCHSMGGLVWRALPLARPGFVNGRAVLVGTPFLGSMLAERLVRARSIRAIFGPALEELTPTAVAKLPPPPGPHLSIAGSTWSPLSSGGFFMLAWARGRPSDSTVLVDETRSPFSDEHVVIDGSHTFLPSSRIVRRHVIDYLARPIVEARNGSASLGVQQATAGAEKPR